MKKISTQNVEKFIKETFNISNSEVLFRKGKVNHEIINAIFKEFTGHQYDNRFKALVMNHPLNPNIKLRYKDYQSFNHLKSLNQLVDDMSDVVVKSQMKILDKGNRTFQLLNMINKKKDNDLER